MLSTDETNLLNELQIIINEMRRVPTEAEYVEAQAIIEATMLESSDDNP